MIFVSTISDTAFTTDKNSNQIRQLRNCTDFQSFCRLVLKPETYEILSEQHLGLLVLALHDRNIQSSCVESVLGVQSHTHLFENVFTKKLTKI